MAELMMVGRGYLNNVKATENSITPDGWFKTGDIAIRDKDGFYTIVDRLKELIKYKGFQGTSELSPASYILFISLPGQSPQPISKMCSSLTPIS
jgi:hypothetical protein